jgi:lycopene cyclase domain-containing protein
VGLIYLGALLVSLFGMVVLDRRFSLFLWRDSRRALIVFGAGMLFFLLWDFGGIASGIFFRGETSVMTGVLLAPELPLEEIFFLALLIYSAMNAFGAMLRIRERSTVR